MLIDTLVSTPYTPEEQKTPDQTSLLSCLLLVKDNIISITGGCLTKATIISSSESAGLLNLVM